MQYSEKKISLDYESRRNLKKLISEKKLEQVSMSGYPGGVGNRNNPSGNNQSKKDIARKESRIEKLKKAGFEVRDDGTFKCRTCGKVSKRGTRLDYAHESGCTNVTEIRLIGPSKTERNRRYQVNKVRKAGLVIVDTVVICPVCLFIGDRTAPWRHFANCPKPSSGRKVTVSSKFDLTNAA